MVKSEIGKRGKWQAYSSFPQVEWPYVIYHSKQDTFENKKGAINNCAITQV